jgi:hypothetical protein
MIFDILKNISNKQISVKLGDKLILFNHVFPYPPFTEYKITCDTNKIKITKEPENLFERAFVKEGGKLKNNIIFEPLVIGFHNIILDEMNCDEKIIETHDIKIFVE